MPHRFIYVLVAAPICLACGRNEPASPVEGQWQMVSYVNLYFDTLARPTEEWVLDLSERRFQVTRGGTIAAEGPYTLGGEPTTSYRGERGPWLELSSWPEGPPDTVPRRLVYRLRADTLTLLTTWDDGTDYTFVRRR